MPSIYDGPAGESLFHTPYMDIEGPGPWNETVPPLLKRASDGDDRSSALLSAMIIEERIDVLLKLWIPGFRPLAADRDFTLSMKIKLLIACKIVPRKICRAADCVRDVRNDFAHKLELESFDHLSQRRVDALRAACAEFEHPGAPHTRRGVGLAPRQLFQTAVLLAAGGLYNFEANLRLIRATIEQPTFEEWLRKEQEKLFWMVMKAMAETPAAETEDETPE